MSTIGDRLDELPDGPVRRDLQGRRPVGRVVEALAARGYDATNVDGGTDEWIAAGYPVECAQLSPGIRPLLNWMP